MKMDIKKELITCYQKCYEHKLTDHLKGLSDNLLNYLEIYISLYERGMNKEIIYASIMNELEYRKNDEKIKIKNFYNNVNNTK